MFPLSGVVDKSVELLSSDKDELTIDRVFDMVESAMISEADNSQIDDRNYCEKKLEQTETLSKINFMLIW